MEVHILKENLLKAMALASKFASSRTHMPVLTQVLIEAGTKGVYLSATNLDIGLRIRVAGKVVEEGSVVVPARVLLDLVQHLPLGGVVLAGSSEQLRVEAGGMKARLLCGKVSDFPPFPSFQGEMGKLKVSAMREVLDKIGFAVSSDEARPVLTGILWLLGAGKLVATDGYRLSVVETKEVWEVTGKVKEVLVPGKAMLQVLQGLEDFGVETCLFAHDSSTQQLLFSGGDLLMTARVLGGDYPQYESILPTTSELEVVLAREELLEAVRAAAIFAKDGANIVKLSISENKLQVSANTALVGENLVDVEAEVKKGKGLSIAFNSRYVVDFLTHCAADRIGIGLTEALRPGLFYEVGGSGYQHVIMPVRVRETSEQ